MKFNKKIKIGIYIFDINCSTKFVAYSKINSRYYNFITSKMGIQTIQLDYSM